MSQMKGQDKTPKLSGNRQASRKRIQNYDSEDNPGSWKIMEKMQQMCLSKTYKN